MLIVFTLLIHFDNIILKYLKEGKTDYFIQFQFKVVYYD